MITNGAGPIFEEEQFTLMLRRKGEANTKASTPA